MTGIHPAIMGLLQELPQSGTWSEPEFKRWLEAFAAILRVTYPPKDVADGQ